MTQRSSSGPRIDEPRFDVIAPVRQSLDVVASEPSLAPFSADALRFLSALSSVLLTAPGARAYPELMALGYWMRPASVKRLAARFSPDALAEGTVFAPRGVVFHLAPSNVDTIFVYSWLLSLLAGNSNVIRLSRKPSVQTDALLAALTTVLANPDHASISRRTMLVRFEPEPNVTAYFSERCDMRVIWGGDTTVEQVRAIPLPPLATELVFGDRFSMAVVSAHSWLTAEDPERERAVHGFVNDAYWFMQMACSSPRLVTWIGSDKAVAEARESFWSALRRELAGRSFDFSPRDYINKRAAAARLAISRTITIEPEVTGDLTRLWIGTTSTEFRSLHCGAGLFWEAACESLDALAPMLDRRIQTVAHFGFSATVISGFLRRTSPRGGDRWVSFGRALDFDDIWDGHDLIRAFSRQVTVSV